MQLTRISHRLTVEARDEKCGPRALLKTITPAKTLLLLACCLWACSPSYPPAPETTEQEVVETLHGVEFRDPFRWLEDQNNEQTRFWIDRQNAYAELIIGQSPLRDAVHQRLKELMDLDDAGSPQRAGDFEYFSLRRRGQQLPVLYRRPKPPGEARVRIDPAEEYETVIDPHLLSEDLSIRVAIRALSEDGKWMVYSRRTGGQDEVELRVRDLTANRDLEEQYENGLYDQVSFGHDSKGFYYVLRSRETGPRLSYHILGTPVTEDQDQFGNGIASTSFMRARLAGKDGRRIFSVSHGWARNEIFLQETPGGLVRDMTQGLTAHFEARYHEGRLLVRTDFKAPNYRVVEMDPKNPGPEHWRELLPEHSDVLQSYALIEDRVYATYLHDVSSKIRVFDLDGTVAGEIPVPDFHSASIEAFGKGKALLSLSSLTRPEIKYLLDLKSGQREIWKESKVAFSEKDYEVKQVRYASKDGTQVPMYIVHRKGIELDGKHPTLLYGYGGFNASQTPRFRPSTAVWLENGGVYAMANLRGGSEFGEPWHCGGMLENKQNVFDDFIAAAEWLIGQGYTNPKRLAITGTSNGGLLVAAALTQRPELFRAVLCGFPDLDMVRFHSFTKTNNMPALLEYGDASDPEQFQFLRLYSPYQNVRQGVSYPAVMLTSGDLDTRVSPLQARKMTAALQTATASGLPVILRYDATAGHAAERGLPRGKMMENTAGELAFLLSQLGAGGP